MCFSASASFTTAVVLTPVGIYTVKTALQNDTDFWDLRYFRFCLACNKPSKAAFGWRSAMETRNNHTHWP